MNIVIIGAGPAGLSAGVTLCDFNQDYNITILEESQEIGGISRTVRYHGNKMDIGGHRFFTKIDRVSDFWKAYMPLQGSPSYDDKKLNRKSTLSKNGPDPDKCNNVMLVRNRVSRIYYNKKFFDYPISMKLETIKNMGFITTITAGISYLKAMLIKKPEDNLENFYINRFGKKLYNMFFEGYTKKLWGRHPKYISADWGAQRVKGLSIIAVLKDVLAKIFHVNVQKETSLIEEFWYPKYGPGQLWETVADDFEAKGGNIIKGAKVTEIKKADNKIDSLKYVKNGKEYTIACDIVVSSMPLKNLVAGMNDVPQKYSDIAKGLPYRDFVTVGIKVNKLNLKNETDIRTLGNIVPDCWIYVQDTFVRLGRIQIFNNWSPYMVEDPDNSLFIGLEYFCNENSRFFKASEEQISRFAINELIKMGVISNSTDVTDSHVEKVLKAYPAYFDTYSEIDELIKYLDKIDNLYCIGRNGQHRYNNMDHSMMTGFLAADAIINKKVIKSDIWNVNTEKEYHEKKGQH